MDDPTSEFELIQQSLRDRTRFRPLYLKFVQPVYKYCLTCVGDTAEAEDLTSQVFLKVMENLQRYRGSGEFASWLFAIVRNEVFSHFRKQRRASTQTVEEELLGSFLDPALKEDRQVLAALLRSISAEERELIRLRYVSGLRFAVIGQILGKSEGAARKAHARLIERLGREWEAENDIES